MENISEPTLPLLEKLPERMQEKKKRKAGIEVPILILISAAALTLYSPNSPPLWSWSGWFTLSVSVPLFLPWSRSRQLHPWQIPIMIFILATWDPDTVILTLRPNRSHSALHPMHQNPDSGSFIHFLASKKSPLIVLNWVNPTFWSSQHMIPILTTSHSLSRWFFERNPDPGNSTPQFLCSSGQL